MKTAIAIIQNIILPKLEQDPKFSEKKVDAAFWEKFATDLLHFEEDAKPIYARIYSLELDNAEKIIDKLPSIYAQFLKELAESHVLEQSSEATQYFTEKNNETFLKEVRFLKTMQQAIKSVERKQIKADLPKSYERLTFELSDADFANVVKKQGRADLKEKFKQWDKEFVEEELTPVVSMLTDENKKAKPTKVISLSWIKYAAAAAVILFVGIFYFNNLQHTDETVIVKADDKKTVPAQPAIVPKIEAEALAEVATITKSSPIIEGGLGYASKNSTIKIIENNQKARKLSIEKAIEKYRQLLEKEFPENKVGYGPREKALQSIITSLRKEKTVLQEREKQYRFDGKVLELYVSVTAKENAIILYNDTYYLKRDAAFYRLTVAKQPQLYNKIDDVNLADSLDNILYENGK